MCSDDQKRKPQPETAIGSLQLSYPAATFPYATPISAATRALFNNNATFAPSVLPPLPFDSPSNKYGATRFPESLSAAAETSASAINPAPALRGKAPPTGAGFANTLPAVIPSPH